MVHRPIITTMVAALVITDGWISLERRDRIA